MTAIEIGWPDKTIVRWRQRFLRGAGIGGSSSVHAGPRLGSPGCGSGSEGSKGLRLVGVIPGIRLGAVSGRVGAQTVITPSSAVVPRAAHEVDHEFAVRLMHL